MSAKSPAAKRPVSDTVTFALATQEEQARFLAALEAYRSTITDKKSAHAALVRLGFVKKTGGPTKNYK